MAEKKKEGTLINCFFCGHFYITDEARLPYGCRALGFKTIRMPAVDVYYASEETDCTLFVRKEINERHQDGCHLPDAQDDIQEKEKKQ